MDGAPQMHWFWVVRGLPQVEPEQVQATRRSQSKPERIARAHAKEGSVEAQQLENVFIPESLHTRRWSWAPWSLTRARRRHSQIAINLLNRHSQLGHFMGGWAAAGEQRELFFVYKLRNVVKWNGSAHEAASDALSERFAFAARHSKTRRRRHRRSNCGEDATGGEAAGGEESSQGEEGRRWLAAKVKSKFTIISHNLGFSGWRIRSLIHKSSFV